MGQVEGREEKGERKMKDGIIDLDSEQAKAWGFTSDKFAGYLWKTGNSIIISCIVSHDQGKGNFKHLIERILADGLSIQIPTPSARMRHLATKWGGKEKWIEDKDFGLVEVIEIERNPVRCAGRKGVVGRRPGFYWKGAFTSFLASDPAGSVPTVPDSSRRCR